MTDYYPFFSKRKSIQRKWGRVIITKVDFLGGGWRYPPQNSSKRCKYVLILKQICNKFT